MTALLETPVGALDVSTLEQRQPDVPLLCTFARYTVSGARATTPCPAKATWEALCVGCGAVFRRCDGHYAREQSTAFSRHPYTGQTMLCVHCDIPVFLEQYVRIGA